MTLLRWKDEYGIGIDAVDRANGKLIDLINSFYDALDGAATKSAVPAFIGDLDSISAHIALEEKIMQDRAYSELAPHNADHERLLADLCDMILMQAFERSEEIDRKELARRLSSRLSNHFRLYDAEFHRHFAGHPH